MFCTNCGKSTVETAKFCGGCGFPFRDSAKPLPVSAVNVGAGAAVKKTTSADGVTTAGKAGKAKTRAAAKKIEKANAAVPAVSKYGKGRLAATIGLCVLLVIFLIAASLIFVIRNTVSEQNISDAVSEIDVFLIMDELDVYDRIIDAIEENTSEELDINRGAVRRIAGSGPVRDFVADNMTGYADALIWGRGHEISRADVIRLVRDSSDLIYEETGYRLSEQAYDEIDEYLRRNYVLDDLSLSAISSSAPVNMSLLRLPLMPVTQIVSIVLSIAALAGIVALNIKRIRNALMGAGISFLLASLPCLAVGVLLFTIMPMLTNNALARLLMESFLSQTRVAAILIGLIFVAAGGASIAAVIYIDNKKVKKATRRAALE